MALILGLALISFVLVVGTWVAYMATVPSGKVPERPVAHLIALSVGVGLALAAIALAVGKGAGLVALVLAITAMPLMMSGLFVYLLSLRKTPVGDIRVAVGDALPAFTSTTDAGQPFTSAELGGQRVLLKFFRGHW